MDSHTKKVANAQRIREEYERSVIQGFVETIGINDPVITDALLDFGGEIYFETRKLISILLTEVEKLITEGKYAGYLAGIKLTEEEKKRANYLKEDLKEYIKYNIEEAWRGISRRQKIGVDKLGIALQPYLKQPEDDGTED